ncbi:YdcF family protein [Massilia forsythiae]|uniref:YdcF family protein n=2 Tax=Massilia forsythiae TaxID=2728020 RepID=A0A7Z2W1J8_9BURK|nr:YdcF family protein [Massilia forsythiae]
MIPDFLLDLLNAIPRDLMLPPANLFLLILIGLLIWRRWPRAGRIVAGTGLAALAFLSTNSGARLFVAPLEAMTSPLLAPERAGAQAIVVLAAGQLESAPEYDNRDIPDYIALARLRYAARLQRRTGLPVLVSGGNSIDPKAKGPLYSKADAMATALRQDFGVPVKWIEPRSRDTAENGTFSAALLRAAGVKRILLVTDAMHMPRARAAFERAGMDVVSAPTLFFSHQPHSMFGWMPSAEGMRRSWYAVYEWLGIVWYRVRWAGQPARGAALAPARTAPAAPTPASVQPAPSTAPAAPGTTPQPVPQQ